MFALGTTKVVQQSFVGHSDLYVFARSDMVDNEPQLHDTGGGQKLCTGRLVLPVAGNIFK